MVKAAPKMSALVVSAIRHLRESHGSTSRDIMNYITSEYEASEPAIQRQMYAALKRGLAYGLLKQRNGHYSLNTEPEVAVQDSRGPAERGKKCRRKRGRGRRRGRKRCRGRRRSSRKRKGRRCKRKRSRKCAKKRRRRCRRKSGRSRDADVDVLATTGPLGHHRVRYDRDLERSQHTIRKGRSRSRSSETSDRDGSSDRREKQNA